MYANERGAEGKNRDTNEERKFLPTVLRVTLRC